MTKHLLDTHAFLSVTGGLSVGRATKAAYGSSDARIFLSLASVWEMAIKQSLGKLKLAIPLASILRNEIESNGLELLPIGIDHALKTAELPFHHRDPFDRLLISQALIEDMQLLSNDRALRKYGRVRIAW